jgi:hypothetical protein
MSLTASSLQSATPSASDRRLAYLRGRKQRVKVDSVEELRNAKLDKTLLRKVG